MITKVFIPVVDTTKMNFDYKQNLTTDEYMKMNAIWTQNAAYGKRGSNRVDKINENTHSLYRYNESEAEITDQALKTINEDFFNDYFNTNKMFIITLNFNPDSFDTEAKSELKYWVNYSMRALNDKTLDWKTKMEYLPSISFNILIKNKQYTLHNCKMLKNYSQEKVNPYKYAIIVEKITDIKND